MKPQLIQSPAELDALLQQLTDEQIIAVDTEFSREVTYFPRLALVQIATSKVLTCIDPLAFDARAGLGKLFLDQRLAKIFHSCSQDLEVLFYYLGGMPAAIYDTQIAWALLNEDHQVSYAALVEREFGVSLDKSQTRTNWLQRPLTDRQIRYAGDDVFYLYQLYQLLDNRLQQAGRKKWFEEECSKLTANSSGFQTATENLWRRVKGSTRLGREQLAIVQSIAEWRELLAQKKDKTRRKILADDIIIQLALDPPGDSHGLSAFIGRQLKAGSEELQALLQCISSARQSSPDCWPDNRFSVLDNRQKQLLKALQRVITKKAAQLKISPGILASKKELEKLILHYQGSTKTEDKEPPADLNIVHGWRYHCIGKELLDVINTH